VLSTDTVMEPEPASVAPASLIVIELTETEFVIETS
jgi:hypothetical protein